MKTNLIYGLGLAALVSSGLAAQTQVVFPAEYEKIEGNSSSSSYSYGSPFYATSNAAYRSYRYMQVMDLDSKIKGKISGLAYRRDGMRNAGKIINGIWVEMEMSLSTAALGSASMSKTFASNIGADATQVVARKKINFATVPYLGTMPEPFFARIPFDSGKQFAYDASKGGLLIDMRVHDNNMYDTNTSSYTYLDLDLAYISTGGSTVSFGDGCSHDFYASPMSYYGSATVDSTTNNLRLYGNASNGIPGQPLIWISTIDGMSKAGAKLPTGCNLYVDMSKMLAMNVALAKPNGSARWPATGYIEMPYSKDYAGIKIDSQALSLNVASGQLYSSNFHRAIVPYWDSTKKLPVARTYKAGATAQTDLDGYGPYIGNSLVMTLTLQ